MWIRPNLSNTYHLARRKSAAFASVGELNVTKLNLSENFDEKSGIEKACEIYFLAKEEIDRTTAELKHREDSRLTKVIRYLLKNRSAENNDGLVYLINNRNKVADMWDAG